MEYSCISICRAFTSKGFRVTQRVFRQQVERFFNSAVQNNTQNTQDFSYSLVNIAEPVRQARRLKCQSAEANFKSDKASQIDSVPVELLTQVNFILERISLSEMGFSKESLALDQTIIFNFYFNVDGKRLSLKKKRHDQSKETPFPLYVAIKIYSHSCSKTMINWLHFCAGISTSYNWLPDIMRELANRILNPYKPDRVFIPCNLKKNTFTIIAKDNILHNAISTTATEHYHGTSFSVFQFPSVVFPGDLIFYPDELPTTT